MKSTPAIWSLHSTRLKIALILMFAIYSSVSMRTSLSMSIVCMVNSSSYEVVVDKGTNVSSPPLDGCPLQEQQDDLKRAGYGEGSLSWSPARQSTLFSASYYGSLATMLVSGPLADKYGPKRILAGAISLLITMTVLAPSLARLDYWAFYASRVVMGMGEGFVIPSANALGVRWFPPTEKSTMNALYTSGIQIAAGSANLIGSFLCGVPLLEGWPLIFYLFASIATCWLLLWFFYVSEHPSQHRFISAEEKEYLEERVLEKRTTAVTIPWRQLLAARELYACLFVNFTTSFLVSINQNFLPLYLKEELRIPLSMNGLFTVLPFLTQLISKNIAAPIADRLKSSGKLSQTAVVKMFQGVSSFGCCISIFCLATLPSCERPWLAAVCMVVYGITFAGGTCGFVTSLMCIAPAYTGTLNSLSMACGQLAAMLATYTVGLLTHFALPHKWLIIFSIGAVIQIFSGTFFVLFGSGEPATWATPKANAKEKEEPANEFLLQRIRGESFVQEG